MLLSDFFMLICLLLMLAIIALIYEQNNLIKEFIKQNKNSNKKENIYREHSQIAKSNFANILKSRTNAYAKYQNKDGLYEPITPKNGIELKDKREE